MSWDLDTDPVFQAELDWVDRFVAEEVEPVDRVITHAWDMADRLIGASPGSPPGGGS